MVGAEDKVFPRDARGCENADGCCFGRVSFAFVSPSPRPVLGKEERENRCAIAFSFTSLPPRHKAFLFRKESGRVMKNTMF